MRDAATAQAEWWSACCYWCWCLALLCPAGSVKLVESRAAAAALVVEEVWAEEHAVAVDR